MDDDGTRELYRCRDCEATREPVVRVTPEEDAVLRNCFLAGEKALGEQDAEDILGWFMCPDCVYVNYAPNPEGWMRPV